MSRIFHSHNICEPRVCEQQEHSALIAYEGMEPRVIECLPYLESFRATLAGLYGITSVKGSVRIKEVERTLRTVFFELEWD